MVLVKSSTMTKEQVGRIAMKASKLGAQGYSMICILHFMEKEDKGVYGSYNADGDFEIMIN